MRRRVTEKYRSQRRYPRIRNKHLINAILLISNQKSYNQVNVSDLTSVNSPSLSDDDIIFEDFARQRLIGAKDDKDEDEEPVDSPKLEDR